MTIAIDNAVPGVNLNEFLSRVQVAKECLGIHVAAKSNDTVRRRITLSIIDEYLMCGGDAATAFFLEASLYYALKQTTLFCTGLYPEEERWASLGKKRFGNDTREALKLVSEGYECKHQYPIVKKIMEVLNGAGDNEVQITETNLRERAHRSSRDLSMGSAQSLTKRVTSHRTWKRGADVPRRERNQMVTFKRGRRPFDPASETTQDKF
jgi:hypothetical protein